MATISRVRAEMVGVDGSPYLSNMYFSALSDPQDCVDKVLAFWEGLNGFYSEDLQVNVDPDVFQINAATGEIIGNVAATGGNTAGMSDTEKMPPANQLLVRWRTGSYEGGREIRGKTYIPALTQDANNEGLVVNTYITDYAAFITTWLGDGPPLLIWSRKNGVTAPAVTSTMWGEFAVLRSRRD